MVIKNGLGGPPHTIEASLQANLQAFKKQSFLSLFEWPFLELLAAGLVQTLPQELLPRNKNGPRSVSSWVKAIGDCLYVNVFGRHSSSFCASLDCSLKRASASSHAPAFPHTWMRTLQRIEADMPIPTFSSWLYGPVHILSDLDRRIITLLCYYVTDMIIKLNSQALQTLPMEIS